MRTEQSILRISIAITFVLAGFGILFGLISGSFAIIFEGVYSLTDASMTIVALLVSNLIATSTSDSSPGGRFFERFTMGFWHLEPMVLGMNGALLMGAAIYALINAVESLLTGGRYLVFEDAIIYAVVTLMVTVSMAVLVRHGNRRIRSDFLALDAHAWLMTAGLTGALLVAFVAGYLIQGTEVEWLSPYIDPIILALVCLVIIPVPAGTVKQALADILLITPRDFKQHIDKVAHDFVRRYGFEAYRAYVAKVGRGRQIELYFIAPANWPPRRLEEWDMLRAEIGAAVGGAGPDRWLTIVFTADPDWAG